MISSLDSNSEAFLNSLNLISNRMQTAQKEITTGLKFTAVSDDPDQVSSLLQTRADLASTQANQQNLSRVKAEADAGEQALQSAVSIMERVRTLGAQGGTGTATPETRQSIASEIGSLLEQLGGISRTSVEGRYIFSGDADQIPPYTIDLTQASPISSYSGTAPTRQVQHPNGTRFAVSKTAQDIFDSPDLTKNVFYSVNNLRVALQNNDQNAIDAALTDTGTALTNLNGSLAYYGTVQNKIAEATDFGSNLVLQLQTRLSSLQDADTTQAILDMQQAQTQQQAALESRGRMPRTSLFDYLG
jgi:flagellar hook-associated protein 3 FlgL